MADWNPISALAAATRHYFRQPNPAATIQAWPMQHAVLTVVGWSVLMLAVFAPLAVHLYRRRPGLSDIAAGGGPAAATGARGGTTAAGQDPATPVPAGRSASSSP